MRRFRCAGEEPQPDGLCDCCWRTWRDGQRKLSPGAYWWLTKVGNLFLLCIECCAIWRKGAAEDPSLEPERITQAVLLTPVTMTSYPEPVTGTRVSPGSWPFPPQAA